MQNLSGTRGWSNAVANPGSIHSSLHRQGEPGGLEQILAVLHVTECSAPELSTPISWAAKTMLLQGPPPNTVLGQSVQSPSSSMDLGALGSKPAIAYSVHCKTAAFVRHWALLGSPPP